MMQRIIFGDNQFFGINHGSDEKSRTQAIKFNNNEAILDVLKVAMAEGLHTFMCTTHERIADLCNTFRKDAYFSKLTIYPCMPYAHKYVNEITDLGAIGFLKKHLQGNILGNLTKGGLAFVQRDVIKMMELLIDAEMQMFKGIPTPVIFLQNVVTDLLLGLGMHDFFVSFQEYVKSKYHAEAGFITLNLPQLLSALESKGIENPIICSSFNKIGYRMSGGKALYESIAAEKRCRLIAMMVLAGGAMPPQESLEYVSKIDGIHSILFGASSRQNIRQSRDLIEKFTRERGSFSTGDDHFLKVAN